MSEPVKISPLSRIIEVFLRGHLSLWLLFLSMVAGAVALMITPREEEPQIVVPMADVMIDVPGATAEEVERQVATRLEKLLMQIDGVEDVYSMSRAGQAIVTVKFFVGQDREKSLVKLYNKVFSNVDRQPVSVAGWVVKPLEIDDVPIVNITLYSDRYDDFALRRMAEEIESKLQAIRDTNRTEVIGGRPRQVRIELDPDRLASRSLTPLEVASAIRASNVTDPAGTFDQGNVETVVEGGVVLGSVEELRSLVVGVHGDKPVYLYEVAEIMDGPAEADTYTWLRFGPGARGVEIAGGKPSVGKRFNAVHIAVAKKKGSDAYSVAQAVRKKVVELQKTLLPEGVGVIVTRDYGQTANDKVNELVESLGIAIIIVIGLIALTLGWREGLIVAVAVPVTFSLTLLLNYFLGYTINRVTLFALILALGLVVDDPIVDVENIFRHFKMRKEPPLRAVLSAVNEVRPPIILATLAVIVSFIPMFFITGMMGPYMRPMAFNVPMAMLMSMVVAFTITPWLSYHLLKSEYGKSSGKPWELESSGTYRVYRRVAWPFFEKRSWAIGLLVATALLFVWALWLGAARRVPLKLLPFDNKNEFVLVLDMPEGTTLETTAAAAGALEEVLRSAPEVTNFSVYVGLASPMDFNGLVRHYYLRQGSNVAEIRVNLLHKKDRAQQSHEVLLRLRDRLTDAVRPYNGNLKLVEVPPGPPVISTITVEVYGPPSYSYDEIVSAAQQVRRRLEQERDVVDVDDSSVAPQTKARFITDKEKAALNGISTQTVAETLALALSGKAVGLLRFATEVNPLPIILRLPYGVRSSLGVLGQLRLKGETGSMVPLAEIGQFEETRIDPVYYHKNLERVVYVFAEAAGRAPAEAIVDMQHDLVWLKPGAGDQNFHARDRQDIFPAEPVQRSIEGRTFLNPGSNLPWTLPEAVRLQWAGEGEWK
ncbi:MAG: efflux RND transporter permease subunit, partial [bacterium]